MNQEWLIENETERRRLFDLTASLNAGYTRMLRRALHRRHHLGQILQTLNPHPCP